MTCDVGAITECTRSLTEGKIMTEFIPPASHPGPKRGLEMGSYKRVGGAGLAAAVLIAFAEAADLVSVWSDWHRYLTVRDYLAGDPAVTGDDLDGADRIAAATGWTGLIALVAAGVVFLVWLWRARQNAEQLCP